ncbi:tRNA (mnm(5)s(2)U34)-methyltransferase [Clostridium magnum]|uniref:16S rRNA m(4) methyltransferase n=1 Tax=Clostridium magnum DSM 2767 TaxID=1121326 RepID=A0A162SEA6_9CLOT|nr:class I SAM-dependent methyltransferase [Clostridium magnum]KZL91129.1 16S rRNA m(4) methyltransferase [Clostridium magnum DSM 2767]SHI18058.1 Putative rRNA methylase [Clostridium magnum DSM 2767]
MFRYVSNVSELSHYIIKNFSCNFNIAVDATLGNGYDTDFLSNNFLKVYSFDIQQCAIKTYENKNINNVILINDSHENFIKYINEKVNCIMYNLGFLPGGDKNITTKCESTLMSLESSLNIIDKGGLITIALYRGHEEGKKEENAVINFVQNLPKEKYGVMLHSFVNRNNLAPFLIVIEKK